MALSRQHALWAALALVAAIGLWQVPPGLAVNAWSVRAARAAIWSGQALSELPTAPEAHARAGAWLGQDQLVRGSVVQATVTLELAARRSPPDPLALVWLGDAYEAGGDVRRATEQWRRAGAWQRMLQASQRSADLGRWDDALTVLKAAREVRPFEAIAYEVRTLRQKGERAAAVALLRQSLDQPARPQRRQEWLLLLGDLLSQEREWAGALEAYRQAVDLAPAEGTWWAHLGQGRALYQLGHGFDAALAQIERGITLRPDKAEGYAAAGDLALAERRSAEAEEWYRKAAAREPDDVRTTSRRLAYLLSLNQVDAARQLADAAVERQPGDARLHYGRAQVYWKLGDRDATMSAALEAVRLDRAGNAGYRFLLGTIYEQSGQPQEAVRWYEAAVQLDSRSGPARVALGRAMYRAGRGLSAAGVELRRAVEVDPASPAGYAELGRLYQAEKRHTEAEEWYREAVARSSEDPWTWTMRGENALLSGNVELATRVLEETTARFPSHAHAYLFLAAAHRRSGHPEQAVAAIERAIELSPTGDVWYWVSAGQIYEWVREPAKALKAYRAALAVDGSNQVTRDALRRLEEKP